MTEQQALGIWTIDPQGIEYEVVVPPDGLRSQVARLEDELGRTLEPSTTGRVRRGLELAMADARPGLGVADLGGLPARTRGEDVSLRLRSCADWFGARLAVDWEAGGCRRRVNAGRSGLAEARERVTALVGRGLHLHLEARTLEPPASLFGPLAALPEGWTGRWSLQGNAAGRSTRISVARGRIPGHRRLLARWKQDGAECVIRAYRGLADEELGAVGRALSGWGFPSPQVYLPGLLEDRLRGSLELVASGGEQVRVRVATDGAGSYAAWWVRGRCEHTIRTSDRDGRGLDALWQALGRPLRVDGPGLAARSLGSPPGVGNRWRSGWNADITIRDAPVTIAFTREPW
jgi:hypothetical protein